MYGPDREGEQLRTPAGPKTEVACLVDRRKFFEEIRVERSGTVRYQAAMSARDIPVNWGGTAEE